MNITRPLMKGIAFLILVGVMLQFTIRILLDEPVVTVVANKDGLHPDTLQDRVDSLFKEHNLRTLNIGENERTLPIDLDLENLLQKMRQEEIEVYVLKGKNNDIFWKIYDIDQVRYIVHWKTTIERVSTNTSSTVIQSPKPISPVPHRAAALILCNTFYKNLRPFIDSDIPFTLALDPRSPFALSNAVYGAKAWHEIMLDARNLMTIERDYLPFVTTMLSDTMQYPTLPTFKGSDLQTVDIHSETLPEGNLWMIDVRSNEVSEIFQWIDRLPEGIELVRISHWDILPHP